MNAAHILVVDDEADIRALLEITLSRMGHRTQAAATLNEAREHLAEHRFNLCITDMRLPDGDGLQLIAHIQKQHAQLPVAVLTAYGSAQMAVDSLKAGAFDFVTKPLDLAALRKLVSTALKLQPAANTSAPTAPELIGDSAPMRELRAMIGRLARNQAPVHIAGESGTGKERVARLIHAEGPRAAAPFVPVNCGAIPGELMESEFFGHRKGAFTGALRDKPGLFQSAEGGTLFLDEVADLPLHMQVKLLRAVQERAVRAVGAEAETPVNVRIISATHKDLGAMVAQGAFRQDLYYRLNVIEVRTAPLREHAEDIPALAQAFLQRHGAQTLDDAALRQLMTYAFPGNVRELENILERAAALCESGPIRAGDLQLKTVPMPSPGSASAALGERVEEMEKQAIREALEKSRHNITRAAKLLGMSFRQLRYRIKKLNIE
ncbi:MAG: sigma-54 dependent transcriptional regulator [Pseudomonadota bacterium]|mgnify:CR=1 FL=1